MAPYAFLGFLAGTALTLAIAPAHAVTIHTPENAAPRPAPEALPLRESVSQHGITWTFAEPARVGRFVTGDWYVVGPVRIVAIDPEPADGRNGSMLNVDATIGRAGFDSRIPFGRFDEELYLAPPIDLSPGDTLLSSISKDDDIKPMLWRVGADQRSPISTVAALTCLAEPVPADAFRPAYAGGVHEIHLARHLRRDLLPSLPRDGIAFVAHQGGPDHPFTLADVERWFERPWIDLAMDEFTAPVHNMPVYGREFSRAVGIASLLLVLDHSPEQKETLLLRLVQLGIDLWGLTQQGQPVTWTPLGGHGHGRKWPIVFAGLMLDDDAMRSPTRTRPELIFSEDAQTAFEQSWTGAGVIYGGHMGTEGHPTGRPGWGQYEHLPPEQWEFNAESWRRCCTSSAWVGMALAARILHAEDHWNHDAFFAYVDRWMTEDDTEHIQRIEQAQGWDYSATWARQGFVYDPFVRDMWNRYRENVPPGPDGQTSPPASQTWR